MTWAELIIALKALPDQDDIATVEGVPLTITILDTGENVSIDITQRKKGEDIIIGNRRVTAFWWAKKVTK